MGALSAISISAAGKLAIIDIPAAIQTTCVCQRYHHIPTIYFSITVIVACILISHRYKLSKRRRLIQFAPIPFLPFGTHYVHATIVIAIAINHMSSCCVAGSCWCSGVIEQPRGLHACARWLLHEYIIVATMLIINGN